MSVSGMTKKIEVLDGLLALCALCDHPEGWRAKNWDCLYKQVVILFRNDVEYRLDLPEEVSFSFERTEGDQDVFTLTDPYGSTCPIKIVFDPIEEVGLAATLLSTTPSPPAAIYYPALPVADAPRPTGSDQLQALRRLLTPSGTSFAPL